ncbi:MAG: histidine kinase dimerization/phospho-acceptor domain-containing protein, partial [Gemmatimonadales bacterium]
HAAGIHALAVLPLRYRDDGRLLGILTLGAIAPGRRFAPDQLPFLRDIAFWTALGADHARLHAEAPRVSRVGEDTLAVVSHDLRNGLNTILTAVALLLRGLPPAGGERRDRKHIEAIRRSAERMNRSIEDALDGVSIGGSIASRRPASMRSNV